MQGGIERHMVTSDGIKDCGQFPHACDKGELWCFTLFDQMRIEAVNDWIVSGGDEGCHIEGT